MGRKKPYTEIGIRRMKCCRCPRRARTQWQVCSDGNRFRPLCLECDFELNAAVMAFMGLPFDGAAYRAKLARQYPVDAPPLVGVSLGRAVEQSGSSAGS